MKVPNRPVHFGTVARDIIEPKEWPNDHGARREPATDPNLNRVVRRVGWRRCIRCRGWFFSRDVVGVQMHADCSGVSQSLRGGD